MTKLTGPCRNVARSALEKRNPYWKPNREASLPVNIQRGVFSSLLDLQIGPPVFLPIHKFNFLNHISCRRSTGYTTADRRTYTHRHTHTHPYPECNSKTTIVFLKLRSYNTPLTASPPSSRALLSYWSELCPVSLHSDYTISFFL